MSDWSWDPSLYAGSAEHYATGRVPYPAELATRFTEILQLDGQQRLLDVGCGPGSLTLLLAPCFGEVIGVDADPDMLRVAERLAVADGIRNATWRHLRAEELPADLPSVDVVTFAQSFHWMDRPRVAAAVRSMLSPGGTLVHVDANTVEGTHPDWTIGGPAAPWPAIHELIRSYLGPHRRAGQGVLRDGTASGEDDIFRTAGFSGPERVEVPGRVVRRTADEILAAVHSLSSAAPHLFGDRLDAFDAELRTLLDRVSPSGAFVQPLPPIELKVWR